MRFPIILFCLIVLFSCNKTPPNTNKEPDNQTVKEFSFKAIGKLERLDPAFDEIVPPSSKIEVIGEGFT